MITAAIVPAVMAAEITTSKLTYYYPEDQTAVILGSDFSGNTPITITINIVEANILFKDTIISNADGTFTYDYPLDGTPYTYIVTATDGTSSATTTFYDPPYNVNFATSGLPAGTSVSVNYSGTNNGGQAQVGTSTFTTPATGVNIGFDANSQVTFSFPSISGYTFSLSDSSPYTTGGSSSPPGHHTITATYTPTVTNNPPTAAFTWTPTTPNEGQSVQFTDQSTDSDGTVVSWSWSFGDGGTSTAQNPTHTFADNGVYTVSLTVTDDDGASSTPVTHDVTVNNVDPDITSVTCPVDPIKVGTSASVSAAYTDPGIKDTQTATWSWGDGTADSAGTVVYTTGSGGSGSVTGTHTYASAGLYVVSLTVTDKDGGTDTLACDCYIVVYDPSAGFVTGGGWIDSPAGALASDPSITGKATFGFVSQYKKGATVPTGNTEFQFHAGDLNFKSTSYQWLVVTGGTSPRAQFKGYGTINGEGNYGFMLTAVDKKDGDLFRIKIWDADTNLVVYDNQMGASDLTALTTSIAGGSIVVH